MIGKIHAAALTLGGSVLLCDGAAVSRTTYSSLFDVIGTTYGPGDGSTTFNLPDYRGYFLRGWDHGAGIDSDAATRTDRGDSTTGDMIGTKQWSSMGTHVHPKASVAKWGLYDFWAAATGNTSTPLNVSGEARPVNIYVRYYIQYE